MKGESIRINLLFPVLNERLRLERGIESCIAWLRENAGIPYELTILDNGSEDETAVIGRALADKYPEVRYVRVEEKGVGVAFRKGIALNACPLVGYMDIDLSTDLRHLQETIHLFKQLPELQYVNGSRFHQDSRVRGRKWYRKITSAGLVFLLKAVFGMKASDAVCGFTFLRKEAAEELVGECSLDNGWFYTIEFLLRAERKGLCIYDMPVRWQEDYDTTVRLAGVIKDYLVRMVRLKKAFMAESRRKRRG